MLSYAKIPLSHEFNTEYSHHYGVDNFFKVGVTMITIINRAYAKKILIQLPDQEHPSHYHKQKEETFHVLYGTVEIELNGKIQACHPGDVVTIEPETRHAFVSYDGAVIEEISSTHFVNDSFYSDENIKYNHCDLLMTNILANPLTELESPFSELLKPNGTILLSGILEEQVGQVLGCYSKNFNNINTDNKSEWFRISASRIT